MTNHRSTNSHPRYPVDGKLVRAALIASGQLIPAPVAALSSEQPSRRADVPLDDTGRREAARRLLEYQSHHVPELLRTGAPWLRAELRRLVLRHRTRWPEIAELVEGEQRAA